MSEWKLIEAAPKTGQRVLLLRDDYYENMAVCYWNPVWTEWQTVLGGVNFPGVTHWMELPDPPNQETK